MGSDQASGDDIGRQGVPVDGNAGMRAAPNLTLRSAGALRDAGLIAAAAVPSLQAIEARYAVAVSPAMRALIGTPDDPIGRQFIPDPAELLTAPFERED